MLLESNHRSHLALPFHKFKVYKDDGETEINVQNPWRSARYQSPGIFSNQNQGDTYVDTQRLNPPITCFALELLFSIR